MAAQRTEGLAWFEAEEAVKAEWEQRRLGLVYFRKSKGVGGDGLFVCGQIRWAINQEQGGPTGADGHPAVQLMGVSQFAGPDATQALGGCVARIELETGDVARDGDKVGRSEAPQTATERADVSE